MFSPNLDAEKDKYSSGVIQNEFLEIMALHILSLRQIRSGIAKNGFFTITAAECADVSNKETTISNLHTLGGLTAHKAHEDVIGLYNVGTIDANSLFSTIEDVLLRMNFGTVSRSNGASKIVGCRKGVATQLSAKEKRALLIHCYGHALNLAVGDSMKQSKVCKNALDTKLVRYSS